MPRIVKRSTSGATTSVAGASSSSCGMSYRSEIAYGQRPEHESSGTSTSRITLSSSVNFKTLDGSTSQAPIAVKGRSKKRANTSSRGGDDAEDKKPKTKRRRTAENVGVDGEEASSKAAPPEKRGAMMRSRPPKAIVERYQRVLSQRFFMINRHRTGDELREEFSVLGSTGNVYTVIIDKMPSCTCPDAMKGNHCKHILFIFCKVLQVAQTSHYWYQKALLTRELGEIFRNAPTAPNAMANARIREAYERASGKKASSLDTLQNRRVPGEEDDCPVCYENMHGAKETLLVWCEACGNALHKECFQQWAKKKIGTPDCVYCRAPWAGAGSRNAGGSGRGDGYVNLASVAGLSPVRDTSTYYHGPRRGQHFYDYQDYDD